MLIRFVRITQSIIRTWLTTTSIKTKSLVNSSILNAACQFSTEWNLLPTKDSQFQLWSKLNWFEQTVCYNHDSMVTSKQRALANEWRWPNEFCLFYSLKVFALRWNCMVWYSYSCWFSTIFKNVQKKKLTKIISHLVFQ